MRRFTTGERAIFSRNRPASEARVPIEPQSTPSAPGRLLVALTIVAATALAACAPQATRPAAATTAVGAPWLERLTYGLNSSTLAEYQLLGRAAYLDAQLADRPAPLPEAVERQIDGLEITHAEPARLLEDVNAEYKRINAMPDGPDKEQARKAINERGNRLAYEAARRHLLRAIYSPAQLREQMDWFWLNHFSVHLYKANLRWLVADYDEHAIRPHVFGRFRELVVATLTHPAMLQYLDNAQNASGHLNENYARELMELHTLGVDGGYTQADVQALARILTGVGINAGGPAPKLKAEWQPLYRRAGAFEFNPARHDFGEKRFLGQTFEGRGYAEIERAVDLLVHLPACARFVSRRIALYFVSDDPAPQLVERMAKTFQATDGEIGAVLRTMLASPEFEASLGAKFKDPTHYVVASLRLAYDGRTIVNAHPIVNWLNALGEPLWGRQTPDGYPLTEAGWASSGQISRRFEIAKAIANGSAGLFEPEDGSGARRRVPAAREPRLLRRLRAAPVGADARSALPSDLAGRVEHLPAGVARIQLPLARHRDEPPRAARLRRRAAGTGLRRTPHRRAAVAGAFPARVPARRIRLRQPARPLLEPVLLRGSAAHRDRAAASRLVLGCGRARRRLGARRRGTRIHRPAV